MIFIYMVYVFGTIGFLAGFCLGILILNGLLKNRSKKDLLEDRGLKWTYGLFVWLVAAVTAYAAVQSYHIHLHKGSFESRKDTENR